MSNFYIICLKYAPGNWQHIKSFAYCLQDKNYNVRLILSKKFHWMNKEYSDVTDYPTSSYSLRSIMGDTLLFLCCKWYFFIKIFRKSKPDMILFVMWHPLNYLLAKIIKVVHPKCRIYIWMHEPYKVDKSEYRQKFLVFTLIEYLQKMILPLIDITILHSDRALRAFKMRYPDYKGQVKVIPLLFQDECNLEISETRYFDITFIGNAVKAKGIDYFFDLLRINNDLGLGLKFQLVTSSNITKYLSKVNHKCLESLELINKPSISDEKIREACAKSFSVLAPYRETTQSGVVPVAFMCGTPVIVTDIDGLRENIYNEFNGMLISKNFACEDVISSLSFIKENFIQFSMNARKTFEEHWSDQNWDKFYSWLMNLQGTAE